MFILLKSCARAARLRAQRRLAQYSPGGGGFRARVRAAGACRKWQAQALRAALALIDFVLLLCIQPRAVDVGNANWVLRFVRVNWVKVGAPMHRTLCLTGLCTTGLFTTRFNKKGTHPS